MESRMALLFNVLAGLTIAWLMLWWFLWTSMTPPHANDLVLEYMRPLNLLALGAGFGIYIWANRTKSIPRRVLRFVMTAGWMITYTSAVNLHMQPTLKHFTGPGVGGSC